MSRSSLRTSHTHLPMDAVHCRHQRPLLRDRGYYYRPKYNATHKPPLDKFVKKSEGYPAKVTQLSDDEPSNHSELSDASDVDENYEVGYYQGVIQATDMNDHVGRCYNCNDPGHKWRDCMKPYEKA